MPFLEFRRVRSEEHTSELQSHSHLVCRLLLEKKKKRKCRSGDEPASGQARRASLRPRSACAAPLPSAAVILLLLCVYLPFFVFFFFFNDTAPTEIYPLSLHDALPISEVRAEGSIIVLGRLRGVAHAAIGRDAGRSEEHTSELQSHSHLVCRLLLE